MLLAVYTADGLFQQYDTNGDGVLDASEVSTVNSCTFCPPFVAVYVY
jgi:hypothetical protein